MKDSASFKESLATDAFDGIVTLRRTKAPPF